MAMRMTGRVLLVCALCMLCCGVGLTNGDTAIEMRIEENPRSTVPDPAVGNAKEQATQDLVVEGPENGDPSLAAQTGNNTKQQKVVVETPPLIPVRTQEEEEEEVKKEESEEPKSLSEDRETSKLLSMPEGERPPPPPPGKPSPVIINGNSAGNTNEAREKELPSVDGGFTQRQVLKSPTAPTAATPQVKNEDLGSADVVSVQQVQKAQSGRESGSESIKEDSVLTTSKQQDGTSDSHAESTPTIRSSAKSVAASNGPEKATEDEISNKNTAGVYAVPEAAQADGNKDDNKKETPIKTTAIANGTASTGDNDSSTAASHTASPLFLLLVIACAAAAAVVAA
ncbi:Mucin-associated surface protein (MASP) [Trypanosoma cruzi]|uniref:Mucin-associated surface protein (MASP), putative n=2 Tax=Trypanosoma cruzi TaxID=5693 RepID=Q4E5K3_TRYCC|nr:mucin-associated surface protein (MASP), putative [Trypanosoma cruzi]EAO00057.1 mucin-associated surface protein (MASP), putative [Trypanosoma cruzi]PWV06131.1 Mucin-associated surface protein (MASP) [Trypanosoma cruzi]|eukprot:XP_821908.1 mucin-associated surface protein (MASP) [Trypanosoma cruzi strain CL Brener]